MKKALVVDDEEANRELLHKILYKEGYEVDEAEDGKISLEMVKNKNYDIIFMDLTMPIMDGYEAIDEIRNNLQKSVSIIVVSANLDKESIKRIFKLGANDYLHKPYNLQTMLKILKENS